MKKTDIILLSIISFVGIVGLLIVNYIQDQSNLSTGTAYVIYNNNPILEIELEDGSYSILQTQYVYDIIESESLFIVEGSNGPVTIEYGTQGVRVIDETSPEHICRIQGWSSSPLKPITCLPNNLVIVIKDTSVSVGIDDTSR